MVGAMLASLAFMLVFMFGMVVAVVRYAETICCSMRPNAIGTKRSYRRMAKLL